MRHGDHQERTAAAPVGRAEGPAQPLRLLLVHDEADGAEALAAIVEERLGPQRSLRVDTLPALDAALRGRDWDLALLTLPLRRVGADEALARLLGNGEPCPVVVLRDHESEADATWMLRAGARQVLDGGDGAALGEALEQLFGPHDDGLEAEGDETLRLVRRLLAACDLRDGLAAASERVLDVVCRALDLPYGESWLRVADAEALAPGPVVAQHPALRSLRAGSLEALRGDVLHEVLGARATRTVDDLERDAGTRFARASAALSLGLDGATAVPVVSVGRVEAMLVTLGRRGAAPDPRLRGVLELAAEQLSGQLTAAREGAEVALERRRASTLLELLHDGVMACDGDGRVTLFNRAMERFHGKPASIGVAPERWPEAYDLYLEDGITAMRADEMPLYRALHGEHVALERFVIAAPGVRRRAVRASASPLEAGDGRRVGALMVVHDESERAAASAEVEAASRHALQTFGLMLDHLAELARRIGEAESLDAVWPAFADFAAYALGADELYVVHDERDAPDGATSRVLYAAGRSPRGDMAGAGVVPPVGSVASEAIRSRRLALERDSSLPALRTDRVMRCAAAAPLTLGGTALGALEVRSARPFAFDDASAVTLTMAANLAALAIDHAVMVDEERRSRTLAEAAARRFQQAFTANPAAVALLSLRRRRLLDVNPAMEVLSGLERGALVGHDPVDLGLWDADAERLLRSSGGVRGLETQLRRSDGSLRTCLVSTEETTLEGSDGGDDALLVLALDVTERLEQQRQLRDLARFRESLMTFIGETLDDGFEGPFYQRLLHAAVRATPNAEAGALLLRDPRDDRYHYVAAFGYVLEALQGVSFDDRMVARLVRDGGGATLVRSFDRGELPREQREALRSAGRSDELAVSLVVPIEVDGARMAVVTLDSFSDPDAFDDEALGLGEAFAAQVATLIKRRALEHELEHMAYHDALTGLPNRLLFLDRLQQAVARAQRAGERGAALFVDVDNLKVTNDALGHAVGDALLSAVAERLRSVVRAEDTVARIGGDEFTVVLHQVADAPAAGAVAEKLLAALREPFVLQGHELHVSASIGVTLFPDDATDADTLVRHGDTAMYQAKAQGKDRFRFFTQEMNRALLERASLEAQLRLALQRDEFSLVYQPRVSLSDGRITRVEALARWHHPERGQVPPGTFIPVAEDAGLIGQLGSALLESACAQAKAWSDAGTPTTVAFNLSAKQLQERDVVTLVQRVLERVGLDPRLLELELTESAVMHNVEENVVTLTRLRELGVQVSIDDFGTAYSSLNYLKQLPATALKIDQSFVRDIGDDADASPHDSAIVRAVIALANALDLVAIAEGIESVAQLRFLRALGCSQGQGYLFGYPADATEVGALLVRGRIDLP